MGAIRFWLWAAVAARLALCGTDKPPAVSFADFRSLASLSLAGLARPHGRALRLTPARRHLAGAAWLREKQPVSRGFESVFQFQLSRPGGLGHGADGLAFVLQNSGPFALGGRGSGGGFALGDPKRYGDSTGIPQSIAIFFDTFRNEEIGDPSNNFVTVCTAGKPREMRWPPPRLAYSEKLAVDLKDRKVHTARITYEPPVLTVYLDGTRVLVSTVDLSTVIGSDGSAWVGFTASTGAGYADHDILNWTFSRLDISSDISVISSNISFLKTACLPGRNLCTPDHAIVDETGPGTYHIVMPGNLAEGASIPNPSGHPVAISNARGNICGKVEGLGAEGCAGPAALTQRTAASRTWFTCDSPGDFHQKEGYVEFDAQIQ